jgi:hypothetical protein
MVILGASAVVAGRCVVILSTSAYVIIAGVAVAVAIAIAGLLTLIFLF